ncbi:MAG: RagB/SusD family nutrient uptake outer membrane protein [Bacteroidales bacterium]|nr:RagB/SusD family nutrient uptake outer membrane protein [Bacteroidales bacterium]
MRTVILTLAAALACTSCLDKFPYGSYPAEDAFSSVDEVNQATIGIYSAFKSASLYSGYLTLLPDIQADQVYAVNGYTNTYGDFWRWNIISTDTYVESVYAALYGVIGRCNFLLDNAADLAETLTDDDEIDELESYCGEAYCGRAIAYAELIKCFCKNYESDEEAKSTPGVILREHYNSDDPVYRSSLYDSYQFVISDLEKAAEYLALGDDFSGSIYNYGYFCEYTAYALRARIALYMGDWDTAIEYASKIIDSGYYALMNANDYSYSSDYNDFEYMWATGDSTENIWKVIFTSNSYGGALGTVFFNYDYVSYTPDYVPAQWVLDLYGSYDLRYDTYFYTLETGYSHGLTWPLLVKYWGEDDFWDLNIPHIIQPKPFRLAEQYLIRAEAYAEQGSYSKAAEDITTLRKARYSSGYSTTYSNYDAAIESIRNERVKELYMEGFRLQDLKRWHEGFTREPQTESLSNGSSLSVSADDPLFVWPIPSHELESPGTDIEPNDSNS